MRRLLSFLLAVAAALAGCRTERLVEPEEATAPAPPADRVVLDAPEAAEGEPLQSADWFETELEAAAGERDRGQLREALERLFRAREQRPPEDLRIRIDAAIREANRQVLELATLRGEVVPEREPLVFGDEIRVRIVLRNESGRSARIPLRTGRKPTRFHINDPEPPDPSSASLFVFEIVVREHDIRSQVVTTRRRVLRPLREPIDLAPGATVELQLSLGSALNDRPLDGFRTVEVGGELRPVVLELDGLRRWEPVALRPATLRVFRPRWEHLADDPVARIGQAIAKDAPLHLLTASALVAPEDRRAAVDRLVGALSGGRSLDFAIFSALHHLTDVELGRDAAAWRAWWPRVRETYFGRPRPAGDGPVFDD